jgi:translation initiation factor IF-3
LENHRSRSGDGIRLFLQAEEENIQRRTRVNKQIRISPIRVVDADGNQLGIVPTEKALEIAQEQGLDLVEVAPQASPPVCRIMDYGKYKYEESQKAKKARKKQHIIQVKEIKLRPKIETHDFEFKLRHARKFLAKSNKVKVTLMFRGREITHLDIARRVMERFAEGLAEEAVIEAPIKKEGRNMVMVLAPNTRKN